MNTIKSKKLDYTQKFQSFQDKTLFEKLDIVQQEFIKEIAFKYKFTFQEFRQVVEADRDLALWQENDFKSWWQSRVGAESNQNKKIDSLTFHVDNFKEATAFVKSKYTVIKAAGGIAEKDGKILLIFRLKKWDIPKGKLDKKEKPKKAAVREVEEECNIRVKLKDKVCNSWHTYKRNGKNILKKTYWYSMDCLDDSEMKPQLEENIEDLRWMDMAEVKQALYNSYPSIRNVLRKYYEYVDKL